MWINCKSCTYFTKDEKSKLGTGRCKRYPPAYPDPARWPLVLSENWCGEHSTLQGFVVEGNLNHDGPTYLFRMLPS